MILSIWRRKIGGIYSRGNEIVYSRKRKVEMRESLKKGYTEMANINLALAESAFSA